MEETHASPQVYSVGAKSEEPRGLMTIIREWRPSAGLAAGLLRHLHAVITSGQRWDPAIAAGGRPTPDQIAA